MDQSLELLLETLRIYSPSEGESKLSEFLLSRMRDLGFRNVRTDRAGNAIGELGSGKPHLLLCGHMDTVPGMLEVRQEAGRVYGRGAVDAKSPMCAMLTAASQFDGSGMKLTIACVTREEGDSLGVNTLIDEGGDYDFAVFGEPSGAARVTVGYRGRVAAKVTVRTRGGHAGSSWAHTSAVDEAFALMADVKRYEKSKSIEGDHYRSLNATPTLVEGGTYSNIVPNICRITLDVRIPPGLTSGAVKDDIKGIVDCYSRNNDSAKVQLEFDEPTEPYEAPLDSLLVRAFQRSILKNLTARPVLTHKTGTGDMNTLAERLGIPCVTYGPGDPRLEHTDGEFVELADYADSIKVLRGVIDETRLLFRKGEGKAN